MSEKSVKETKKCPTCSKQFLGESTKKQCESCENDGKTLLNE